MKMSPVLRQVKIVACRSAIQRQIDPFIVEYSVMGSKRVNFIKIGDEGVFGHVCVVAISVKPSIACDVQISEFPAILRVESPLKIPPKIIPLG